MNYYRDLVNKNESSVLLPSGYSRTEYVVFRSLVSKGIRIHLADSARVGMCQWSRYKKQFWVCRSPMRSPEAFMEDVAEIARQVKPMLIFPTDPSTTLLFSKYRELFTPDINIPVAEYDKMLYANNKLAVTRLADNLSVPVPKSYTYSSLKELKEKLRGEKNRLVVKLLHGHGSKGIAYPENVVAVINQCQFLIDKYGLSPGDYPLVQQHVSGEGWGVSCLYWHGEKVVGFAHRRLREKFPTGGTSTLRVSAHCEPLENAADQLLKSLKWHGLAMVEFKYDPASNKYWLMEINPRVWGSIALAVDSGVDFPYLVYLCALGKVKEASRLAKTFDSYPVGRIERWLLGDLVLFLKAISRGKFGYASKIMFESCAHNRDDLKWDDPMAFLGEIVYYATHGRG